ncbi:Swt1 family HEPN domain-containing protein [Micromonospora sp. CA-269861]|uniref:Swt1 family HEPN domain-containing protein n=1 Tax=Micromonospora sp. CA-269861 TaxID=3239968 RepID=UPI003D92569B
MAISNRDQVGQGLDLLAQALEPFVARVLAPLIPAGGDWTALLAIKDGVDGRTDREYAPTDPQCQLRVITERLGDHGFPFDRALSRAERNLANELREVRNRWAHREPFSPDDAYRALDTTERLLRAVGAVAEADRVKGMRLNVQRGAYEQETRRAARAAGTPDTADPDLPSWREVLEPHPDVQSGTFAASEFAADLYRVAVDPTGVTDEYADPVEFFRRTYLTEGLRDLLRRAVARVAGNADAEPVVNLQTTFGGGKTHSMLAVWHLFSGRALSEYPQEVQDILGASDPGRLTVRRVALVGNEIAPGQPVTKPDGTVVRTLWGELAWQLGGSKGYAHVAEADRTGTNPGAALRDLFAAYAPAVVLVDEWVAYARQLYGRDDLPAGTFETQFTFAQSLTQAVAAVAGALLLVSVPASDVRREPGERGDAPAEASELEVGGAYGREALQRLDNVVRRVAYQWAPASRDESYEIVRRRLFREPDNTAIGAINATARRFVEHYRQHPGEFPGGVTDSAYEQRIRTAFPIHPELLDRLYTDWSPLDRFQRTRGVLRLMSTVVHQLWTRGDRSPLIMPASVPLDATGARSEVVQYVDPRWAEIIQTDIDGEDCVARRIDVERPLLGKRSVTLRVARTLFLDSAPTLDAARKGVDRKRIALGVAMPGDVVGNFGSALDGLVNQSSHLFRDGDRYWYDTQPSLNRLAAERARDIPLDGVHAEVLARMRRTITGPTPEFAAVIVGPESTGDVAEDENVRLVVLHPEHRHNGKDKDSSAARFVLNLLRHRGTAPRLRPNTLVVLAADDARWRDLESTVRNHLAWRSITDQKRVLDLTQQNAAQAERRTEETSRTIDDQIPSAWIWALHAVQREPAEPLTVGQIKCDGTEKRLTVRTGAKLVREDALRTQVAPAALHVDLVGPLRPRWNRGHIAVGELWDFYTRHPYLPRMRDRRVLTEALRDVLHDPGWQQQGFALATGYDDGTGVFAGLVIPLHDLDFPDITDTTLLVRPDLATQQRRDEEDRQRHTRESGGADGEGGRPSRPTGTGTARHPGRGTTAEEPRQRANVRWTGRFDVDPDADVETVLAAVSREVIAHLRGAEPEVLEITLEVTAERRDGFDTSVVRTVTENSRTLGASRSRFEDA